MKKGLKITIGLILMLAGLGGRAELLSRAASCPVVLDLATNSLSVVKVGEVLSIEYSPLFVEGNCETIRLNEIGNGTTNKLFELNEAGVFDWNPASIGVKTLELEFLKSGEAVGVRRIGQVEVWNERVVLDRGDIPLRELMPTKYQNVAQVTIGCSVTNLSENLLVGCAGIRSVELNSEAVVQSATLKTLFPTAYAQLTHVVLGEEIQSIPDGFFEGCVTLTNLSLPNGLVSIGEQAFSGCSSLVSVFIPATVQAIGTRAFEGCVAIESILIPYGVTNIGTNVFFGCSKLTAVTIPESVKTIGDGLFNRCESLSSLVIPQGIVSIGAYAFADCISLTSVSMPKSVTEIGDCAFGGCAALAEIVIPPNVTNVGAYVFNGCAALSSVVLPERLVNLPPGLFYGCSSLLRVNIPENVETIGYCAFYGCMDLESITIPQRVTYIDFDALGGCSGLRSVGLNSGAVVRSTTLKTLFPAAYAQLMRVVLGEDVTVIPDGFFEGCTALTDFSFTASVEDFGDNDLRWFGEKKGKSGLWVENGWVLGYLGECPETVAIPAGVKGIASHAFEDQETLGTIQFPDSLVSIGVKAFRTCTSLERLTVPEGVTRIGDGAFQDCTWMQSLDLSEGLSEIGDFAFANCSTLERLVCPEGLVEIGTAAFSNCWRMLSVSIPASVDAIGDGAFAACSRLTGATVPTHVRPMSDLLPDVYRQLETITIAEGETALVTGAFANCAALTHIDLPQGLEEVPARSFWGCSKLTGLELPEGARSIGSDAFRGTALSSIEFPSTLETIGDSAFYRLRGLSELVLPPSLRSIGGYAFTGCSGLTTLVIPARVTSLGVSFIRDCSSLESVYFLGSAPAVVAETYAGTPESLVSYVIKGSTGWDGVTTSKALPQSWPTSNSRAIAYWEPNVFAVTFLGNGGEPAEQTVSETTGATYVLPEANPVRMGARFAGWWTEPENGGEVRATTNVELTHAHALYAHWNFFGYTVAFDLNGVSGSLPPLPMTYGTAKRLPACPVRRVNYDFAGWALTRGGAVAFTDGAEVLNLTDEEGATVTLHAVWKARTWMASDYLDDANLTVTSAGDAAWIPDPSVSHDGLGSMRSGALDTAPEGTTVRSVLKTVVKGNGLLTFWWKVNCEPADAESGDLYDYLELTVDGERPESAKPIAGDVDWARVSVWIEGDTLEHEIAWSFVKDDYDELELPDAAWVDEVSWTPDDVEVIFDGNGATGGAAPTAIRTHAGETVVLPDQGTLVNDGFKFVGWTDGIRTYAAGEAYPVGVRDALLAAVWKSHSLGDVVNAPNLTLTTGGDAEWEEDSSESRDGVSSLRSGAVAVGQESWLEVALSGSGTLTFWWKSDGLTYRGKPANYVQYQVDGGEAVSVAMTDWAQVSVSVAGAGAHTVRWTYRHTRTQSSGSDCAWLDEVSWNPSATGGPSVSGDPDATVTGDAENGFVVRPGAANADVVVEIPGGVDASKVTVEVSPDVRTVTPNGAAVRVVRGGSDITDYLDIPAAVGGVIVLSAATVKAEYANEPLDVSKGAVIDLSSAENPSLTTARTRKGLTYRLKEGATLDEMAADADGDHTVGDGAAWKPNLTVRGGASGFYTITVEK